MSNLIDKQAAIDASKNAYVCVSYTLTEPIDDIVEASIKATKRSVIASIETIEAVQPEPQWIPVSERCPDKAGAYLITNYDGDVFPRYYDGEDSSKKFWKSYIKAWMPLPDPYQEEGEQDEQAR